MTESGCHGMGKGTMGVTANRSGVYFQGDDNVLELDSGDGCVTLWIYRKVVNLTL